MRHGVKDCSHHETITFPGLASSRKHNPNRNMKNETLLIGITMSGTVPMLAQGFLDFSWTAGSGIKIGTLSNPSSQSGWYVAGDYSVEAWMATGAGRPQGALVPIASTKTVFIGGATTTAGGSPATDGSGLWYAGPQDTGLPTGLATIHVRAWYDPNHNTSWEQAHDLSLNVGISSLYNINLVTSSSDPTIQSLDNINFQAFTVADCAEPSTFALAGLGAAAMLMFRRWK